MRRKIVYVLVAACVVISIFIADTLGRIFSANPASPATTFASPDKIRLVLISQEMDSPFWVELEKGAFAAAEQHDIGFEAWGTFGFNEQDFLQNIEIAIASRVHGIIVQGLDTEPFKKLAVRATSSGIPVITVASDVPAAESLRKTYVGTNHYEAGKRIARQMLDDMRGQGEAVLLVGDRRQYDQRERLRGILDEIKLYPGFSGEIVESGNTSDEVAKVVRTVLNEKPSTRGLVSVAHNNVGVIVREIGSRYRLEEFYIYSFDETPETLELMRSGAVEAVIAQDPFKMGELSVQLMMQWLEGKEIPLNLEGYYTGIQVLKAEDLP